MAVALDAGAEDLRRQGQVFAVITDVAQFLKVQEAVRGESLRRVVSRRDDDPQDKHRRDRGGNGDEGGSAYRNAR